MFYLRTTTIIEDINVPHTLLYLIRIPFEIPQNILTLPSEEVFY